MADVIGMLFVTDSLAFQQATIRVYRTASRWPFSQTRVKDFFLSTSRLSAGNLEGRE